MEDLRECRAALAACSVSRPVSVEHRVQGTRLRGHALVVEIHEGRVGRRAQRCFQIWPHVPESVEGAGRQPHVEQCAREQVAVIELVGAAPGIELVIRGVRVRALVLEVGGIRVFAYSLLSGCSAHADTADPDFTHVVTLAAPLRVEQRGGHAQMVGPQNEGELRHPLPRLTWALGAGIP